MIYQKKFVFNDKLVSPLNGYICKKITKQNVKFFGFNSIEELRKEMPLFPLFCKELLEKQNKYLKKAREIRNKNIKENTGNKSFNKCMECENLIKGKFGKLFCSKKCSAKNSNKSRSRRLMWTKKFMEKGIRCSNCNKCLSFKDRRSKYCENCRDRKNRNKNTNEKCKRTCKSCKNEAPFRKVYCGDCKTTIRHYRSLCKFRFNVYDFPCKFDLSLIDKYGWYSPCGAFSKNKNINLSGVSRDHLYSVFDGFKEGRDPNLIAHPANCRIMIHNGPNGNNSKKNKSIISWEELLLRIEKWDK